MEKVQENIDKLEAAIKHLNQVIKHLGYNSGEIKSQIHATISRHLEALRNREVWLLSQVDVVVSAKEEVLHQQEVRLNKVLGVLQSSLALPKEEVEARLADALTKLDLCELKPDETPYITFKTDNSNLRENILSYGRVDATGLPLQSAFVAHGHPSRSLPRHFEEYEDDEHHVFYKTLEEINRGKTACSNISVGIPKLSTRSEDWLRRPATTTTSSSSAPRFSFPVLSPKTSDWLRCSDSSKTVAPKPSVSVSGDASIQNWLSQIKQFPDLEEEDDDFELIDKDESSQKSVSSLSIFNVMEESHSSNPAQNRLPFPSSVEAWLKYTSKPDQEEHVEKPAGNMFRHIPQDKDKWLIKKLTKETDTCSTCNCNTGPQEIENLGNAPCAGQAIAARLFRDFPLDQKRWLKSGTYRSKPAIPADVCKANETCSSFSDCVCQPTCGFMFAHIDNSPKKWLKSVSESRVAPLPRMEGFDAYLKSVDSDKAKWLKDGGVSSSTKHTQDFTPMFQSISQNIDDWIRDKQPGRNKNSPSITAVNFDFKHGKDDRNMWLKYSDCLAEDLNPLPEPCRIWDTIQDHVDQLSMSDWLIKKTDPSPDSEKIDENKDVDDEKDDYEQKWQWLSKSTQQDSCSNLVEWLYQKNL